MTTIDIAETLKILKSKYFQEYFQNLKSTFIPVFIKRDWYLSYWFLVMANLENIFYEEKTTNLDNIIIRGYDSYSSECKRRLLKNFPERKKVLLEVFYCFNNKQYSAVITLAYSTAEGLISSNFGHGFWGGYDSKTRKILVEKLRDDNNLPGVMNLIHKRLSHRGEINRNSKSDNIIDPESNNRHLVLHGRSYNYGTKKMQ